VQAAGWGLTVAQAALEADRTALLSFMPSMPTRPGHIIGGLWLVLAVTGCTNDPNPSMVETARSLAPPETTITEVGENTGSHVVVGDYFATVDVDDGGLGADGLLAALAAHADAEGWVLIDTEELAGGTRLTYTRDGLRATITVFAWSPAVHATIRLSDG
jgi:hypothetical protein